MIKTVHLVSGKTYTVESFFNATATAFFKAPASARINVKYGKGRLSVNRQAQVLDGNTVKKLSIGKGSILYARLRVKVPKSTDVTYDVYPRNIAIETPEQHF
ncbi:hypothetical protein [Streptomyces canus]|uniref:hypothetical protein n=1 Tax=Streptomyces canus TaxID=58343 RepID=UPI002E27F0A6|nr:hypothetical protein [Streptomyces canus]